MSTQKALRGKSANHIKNILIGESLLRQKQASDQDAALSAVAARRTEWLRAVSESRDYREESQHIESSQDCHYQLTIKHSNLNANLANIRDDLTEFTHRTEAVLNDSR